MAFEMMNDKGKNPEGNIRHFFFVKSILIVITIAFEYLGKKVRKKEVL